MRTWEGWQTVAGPPQMGLACQAEFRLYHKGKGSHQRKPRSDYVLEEQSVSVGVEAVRSHRRLGEK